MRRKTRISLLMSEVGWLTIKEMSTLQGCVLFWKMLHKNRPENQREKLTLLADWSVTLSRPRLQFTERCMKWKICSTWNMLEEDLRKETSRRG